MVSQFFLHVYDIFIENMAFIFVALVFIYYYFKKETSFTFMTTEDRDSSCSDKQCVRCNKYKDILQIAFQRLSTYSTDKIAREIQTCLVETKHRIKYLDQKPNVFFFERLFSIPLWDRDIFPDTTILEEGYSRIFEEFTNLPDKDSGSWIVNNTPLGCWYVFPLINQGHIVEENSMYCSNTIDIINQLPSSTRNNVFSNVMFSVIKPQTLITDHYGPTNIRMRCHLGLLTTPACTLTVADQTLTWKDGQCLVFDDSFLHGVEHAGPIIEDTTSSELLTSNKSNMTTADRAVLIVDLWHPDLSNEERAFIDTIFGP